MNDAFDQMKGKEYRLVVTEKSIDCSGQKECECYTRGGCYTNDVAVYESSNIEDLYQLLTQLRVDYKEFDKNKMQYHTFRLEKLAWKPVYEPIKDKN